MLIEKVRNVYLFCWHLDVLGLEQGVLGSRLFDARHSLTLAGQENGKATNSPFLPQYIQTITFQSPLAVFGNAQTTTPRPPHLQVGMAIAAAHRPLLQSIRIQYKIQL
jgi:hypothetical protein